MRSRKSSHTGCSRRRGGSRGRGRAAAGGGRAGPWRLPGPVAVVCVEGKAERRVAALATHDLDLVLADVPVPPGVRVKAFSHLLGETTVTFFGTAEHVRALRRGFPRPPHRAPLLPPP